MAAINPLGRRRRLIVPLLSATLLFSSCYSYRLATQAQSSTEGSTRYSRRATSLFWGLLNKPQVIHTPNCDSLGVLGVSEVAVKTNFGGALLTVLTLGIYHPVRVEWKCSKPCPKIGEL
jgi:hypothetical protein